MKYHAILTPALASLLTSVCLLTSTFALATGSTKVPADKQARWFEIEVILFKNISKNSADKEQFTALDLTAKKRRAFDLLGPYLQPNISSLKKLLPSCEQQAVQLPYDVAITPYYLWTEGAEAKQNYQTHYANSKLATYDQYPSDSQAALCVIPNDFFQQHLSAEQLKFFSIDGFPLKSSTTIVDGMEQWHADETGKITWASNKPYLISKDSLRLTSIANRIKRSRDYVPLLHFGWRQIGETRRKAQAMKLYAGEQLNFNYEQALAQQDEQQESIALQAILAKRQQAETLIHSSAGSSELSIVDELHQQQKQQQLDALFQQLSQLTVQGNQADNNASTELINVDGEALTTTPMFSEQEINNIVAQLSTDITVPVNLQLTDRLSAGLSKGLSKGNAAAQQVAITAPSQPWSVDGLFKIHLSHYLYINSELNIIPANGPLKNGANNAATENQVISFKQSRRVITGEIHYFDNPYIGMIVQIRRFDPTKPADEAVSQSKK